MKLRSGAKIGKLRVRERRGSAVGRALRLQGREGLEPLPVFLARSVRFPSKLEILEED